MGKGIAAILSLAVLFLAATGSFAANPAEANSVILFFHDLWLQSPQNIIYLQDHFEVSVSYFIPNEPANNHEPMRFSNLHT